MNETLFIILIILIISSVVPRLLPSFLPSSIQSSHLWQALQLTMPSLLAGLLVMLALPSSFFTQFAWIEISGLLIMIIMHLLFKKPMWTMLVGSLWVVIIKTWM
jgi:branched-subunit amino acid transport protein AzlD